MFFKLIIIDFTFIFQSINGKKYNDSKFEFTLEKMPEPAYFEKAVMNFLSFLRVFWQLFVLPCIVHTASNIATEKYNGMQASFFYMFFG